MASKKLFDEITDWSRIDYICVKSKMQSLDTSVYYLDGHPMFEKTLSDSDVEFMNFVRKIKGYGTSEKMLDGKTTMDRFYVRVNLKNDQQEKESIDYLKKKAKMSEKQMKFLDYLRGIDNIIKSKNDCKSLYYCGFSKKNTSSEFDEIRFYFKTFGVEESIHYDEEISSYLEKNVEIKEDMTFQIVRELIQNKKAGLRCLGLEFDDSFVTRVKYYLCQIPGGDDIKELLHKLKEVKEYTLQAEKILFVWDQISDLQCDMIQLSSGYKNEDANINLYLCARERYKQKYYVLEEGAVLRDIGGVFFLVNIHEKYYYDLKHLLSVNETGQVIIRYMQDNKICTLDGIVSHLRSKIINYTPELYPIIYEDCKAFIEKLYHNNYLKEVN